MVAIAGGLPIFLASVGRHPESGEPAASDRQRGDPRHENDDRVLTAWWPRAHAHAAAGQRATFCNELSHLATAALVVVLVTGLYNVMQDTAQASAPLISMGWGRILAAKLVCVAAAVALGGWNRLVVLPDLRARAQRDGPAFMAAQGRFNTWLSVEALAMLAVLAFAAVLGHTPPTGG